MTGTRRLVPLLLIAAVALLAAAYGLGLFAPPAAHLAALVPEDATFAVVSSSVNDLRELYVSEYQVAEFDAARTRLGEPVNVPGLNGVDYDRPVGLYFRPGEGLVRLVPIADLGAFEAAHRGELQNVNVKAPVRVAKGYVSVAESDAVAGVGPDNRQVLEAAQYPLALVGNPTDSAALRGMLLAMFGPERPPRTPNVVPLSALLARMPENIARLAAAELGPFRLAVLPHEAGDPAVRFDLLGEATSQSHLGAAVEYAGDGAVADLIGVLPAGNKINTIAAAAVVLNAESWQELGLPMNVGPAAGMVAVVQQKYRAGRHTIVFGLAPKNERAFERIAQTPLLGLEPDAATTPKVDGPEIRLFRVPTPPASLAHLFASDAQSAPPLYFGRVRIQNAWYCALGAHAEEVLRAIADGASGASPAVMRGLFADEAKRLAPTVAHTKFFRKGLLAAAFLTAEGTKALRHPFPFIQTASIGMPEALTLTVEPKDGKLHADLRAFRPERK